MLHESSFLYFNSVLIIENKHYSLTNMHWVEFTAGVSIENWHITSGVTFSDLLLNNFVGMTRFHFNTSLIKIIDTSTLQSIMSVLLVYEAVKKTIDDQVRCMWKGSFGCEFVT